MAVNLHEASPATSQQPIQVSGELRCALTGRALTAEEAYWAPPLVTAWDLVRTIATTLVRTPSNLGHVLMSEDPNVPYAPEARQMLAARRSAEQVKLLLLVLVIASIIIAPIVMVAL